MIKISVLHPSRQRPILAKTAFLEWLNTCEKPLEVEYLLGLDSDDPVLDEYKNLFTQEDIDKQVGRFVMFISNTTNIPAVVNELGKIVSSTSELLVVIADDMGSVKKWDIILLDSLKDVDNFKEPKYIGVCDGIHPYGEVLLYTIINKAFYNKFNYVLYPEYTGCFVDLDMFEVVKRMNCLIDLPFVVFQHHHYSIGQASFDTVYARHNNPVTNVYNEQVYLRRKLQNFGF
jgi:hypothetical protein